MKAKNKYGEVSASINLNFSRKYFLMSTETLVVNICLISTELQSQNYFSLNENFSGKYFFKFKPKL